MTPRSFISFLLCIPLLIPALTVAQDSEDDEVFELSPFEISDDRGYRSRSKGRTEPEVTVNDIGATIEGISGPYDSRLIRGRGVRVDFAIGFYDDEESVRRETLNKLVDQVRRELLSREDLNFEPGEILVPEGDRKRGRSNRRSTYTSYAHFDVSFEFGDGASPFERVLEIRQIVGNMSIRNDVTKIFFGGAKVIDEGGRVGLLNGVGYRYQGYHEVDDLGAVVPYVTDDLGRQLSMSTPLVAVTIVKPADRIRIEFSLEVTETSEASRLSRIQGALEKARIAVLAETGLGFEIGSVNLSKGNGSLTHARPQSSYYAEALFSVTVELSSDQAGLEQVGKIREKLYSVEWEGVRLRLGVAALVVENAERYRSAILEAIFADLRVLDEGLGELFEIKPKIENRRVQMRHASRTEVEFWIPYSYEIVSVRDREQKRALFELELEKARSCRQDGVKCCSGTGDS